MGPFSDFCWANILGLPRISIKFNLSFSFMVSAFCILSKGLFFLHWITFGVSVLAIPLICVYTLRNSALS